MGSMHTGLEDGRKHFPSMAVYFAERARGGVGLMVTGGFAPNIAGWTKPFAGMLATSGAAPPTGRRALKDMHDELDAAVLQAYGLEARPETDAPLTHLTQRTAHSALRKKKPATSAGCTPFQNPAANNPLSNQELLEPLTQGLQAEMELQTAQIPASTPAKDAAAQAWPAQVRALAQALAGRPGALTVATIEAQFKGRGRWKKGLPRILETLEAPGRARREGDGWCG